MSRAMPGSASVLTRAPVWRQAGYSPSEWRHCSGIAPQQQILAAKNKSPDAMHQGFLAARATGAELLQLGFLVDHVLAGNRVELFDFHAITTFLNSSIQSLLSTA
jgi:hypothetical protein